MRKITLIGSFLILLAGPLRADMFFTASEDVLLSSEYANRAWGPGSGSRIDVAGEAVLYVLGGVSPSSATAFKDNYPVQDYGQTLPSHGSGDFSKFDGYALWFSNVGQDPLSVGLFMNTGFTGPSGIPSSDSSNDTFWQSEWHEILPGQSMVVSLDFDYAQPFNISDNKPPHTQGANEVWTAINGFDRAEVSSIGFQILGSSFDAEFLVGPSTIPEPAALLLFGLGALMFRMVRKGCRRTT